MTPVVNGLADEYQVEVEFRLIDAGRGEGQAAFKSYGLPGHPSYIILDPEGEELWRGFGPQTRDALEDALAKSLQAYGGSSEQGPSLQPLPTLEPLTDPADFSDSPPVPTLNPQLVVRGEEIYQQHCSACHGINLEGQPDWQNRLPNGSFPAPPHDSSGHTWHHPDALLLEIIAKGGNPALGATMPGFAEVINEQDRPAVLEFIKSYWGDEEREFQWLISSQ